MNKKPIILNPSPNEIRVLDWAQVGNRDTAGLLYDLCMFLFLKDQDIDSYLATLATAVGMEDLNGEPMWLMIVGPPSGGKTTALQLLSNVADHFTDEVTVPGLLGIQVIKDVVIPSGILLPFEGGHGLACIKDMSTMLGSGDGSQNSRAEVFAALRAIYDGEFSRSQHRGTVTWKGRMTFLGACTPAIDNFSTFGNALGARFVYYRLRQRNLEERKAMNDMVVHRENVVQTQDQVANISTKIVTDARRRMRTGQLPTNAVNLIAAAAEVLTLGRGNVPRERFGTKHEISGTADWEETGRATRQLTVMTRALLAMEVKPRYVGRILRRITWSSMSPARANVLLALAEGGAKSTNQIATESGMTWHVAHRALEEWTVLGDPPILITEKITRSSDPANPTISLDNDPKMWAIDPAYTEIVKALL